MLMHRLQTPTDQSALVRLLQSLLGLPSYFMSNTHTPSDSSDLDSAWTGGAAARASAMPSQSPWDKPPAAPLQRSISSICPICNHAASKTCTRCKLVKYWCVSRSVFVRNSGKIMKQSRTDKSVRWCSSSRCSPKIHFGCCMPCRRCNA